MTVDKSRTDALEQPSRFSLWLNGLPVAVLATGVAAAASVSTTTAGAVGFFVAWLYLLPPLACRVMFAMFGRPEGELTQDLSSYRVWWTATQLQLIFNRIGWLEELLRLVPGLYALWIYLWGGRLSPQTFVGPGVTITDRYMIDVGPGCVLGAGCALAGHMVMYNSAGRWVVTVAAPVVERQAIVGGNAGLGPGARLRAGEMLPSGRRVAPFATWPRSGGKSDGSAS